MTGTVQDQPTPSADKPKEKAKRIGLGVLLATIAAIVTAAANIEKFAGLIGRIAPTASELTMATVNTWPKARAYLSSGLTEELFQQPMCNTDAQGIDMDGNGVSADLAVFYSPTRPSPDQCYSDAIFESEVAFFRWDTTGYIYVGAPPKQPDEIASWRFVGPALLRTVANSDTPPVEVYAYNRDRKLSHVGNIDTYNDAEQSWLRTKDIGDGALIEVPTGLWRLARSADGTSTLSRLKLTDIMEVDGHSRLLSYMGGRLTLDGHEVETQPVQRADDDGDIDKSATITVRQLDRLYLEGCISKDGLSPHSSFFGAYRIDPAQGGNVFCGADEDGGGTAVQIRFEG
jgi:hypothetical protein